MNEQLPETPHERRITWGLMALVAAFVVLMTAIVLWVTTSLIRFEQGGASRIELPRPYPSITPTATTRAEILEDFRDNPRSTAPSPALVNATWTPAQRSKGYVRFLYWYVKPNQIQVGECIQLTWEIVNAVDLKLYRNGELIVDDAPASKTLQDCPTDPGYAVYRMVGVNSAGESNFIQLQVKVKEAP